VMPVAMSQALTVSSSDADARYLPSGENAIDQTQFEWPSSVRSAMPVVESQSLIVVSSDADASYLPLGQNTKAKTRLE
jgi:hypothetical protein